MQISTDYANRVAVPDFQEFLDQWKRKSDRTYAFRKHVTDIYYGPHRRQCLDIFLPENVSKSAPVLVYVHGGWWCFLTKEDNAFVAEPYLDAGCVVVCLEYPLAPELTIDGIVRSVQAGISWVVENISRFGGDPGSIYLAGQSAGAHLAVEAATRTLDKSGSTHRWLRGIMAVSGLYDLNPILMIEQNRTIRLDDGQARINSPIHHLPHRSCPLLLAVGAHETPGFIHQHESLLNAWTRSAERPVSAHVLPGEHHFQTMLTMADPKSVLSSTFLRWMRGDSLPT